MRDMNDLAARAFETAQKHEWRANDRLARTAPSSAFGTFSPARNRGGEGLSTGYRVPTIPVRVREMRLMNDASDVKNHTSIPTARINSRALLFVTTPGRMR